jgi:hypothetical protein
VVRAVYEASGDKPELWANPFNQQLVDQYYPKAIQMLQEIHPYVYGKGAYPAGNYPTLELFSSGEVSFGLFFLPALQSFIRTISDGGRFSLTRYSSFFGNPIARSNLLFILFITLASIAVLFAICFPLVLYLRFSKSRIANWALSIAMLPLFVPVIMSSMR